jgi:hypothetical protein
MIDLANESYFDRTFKELVRRTCKEWDYDLPKEQYYKGVYKRFPLGLRATLGFGFSQKIILDAGKSKTGSAAFRPVNVPASKGPYSWFEKDNQSKQPRPNWEYCIQLSEYIRLYEAFKNKGYELTFEDSLMDIGIYLNKTLKVCCEIKEKSSQAERLIKGIKMFEDVKELPGKDRGKDALRKAKYIIKLKPLYFYVVSIGRRFEFRVSYADKRQFELVEDLVPFI